MLHGSALRISGSSTYCSCKSGYFSANAASMLSSMLTAPIGQLSPVYCTVVSVSSAPSQSAVSSCMSLALWSTRRKRTVRLIFFSTFSSLPIYSFCPGTSAFLPGFSTISPVGSGSSVRFTRFVAIPISRFIGLSTTMVERTLPSPFSDTLPDAPRISS